MPRGTLEVLLVNAKGLDNADFLCNMDPYVILTCRTQKQKSSVASRQGSDPEWNEHFVFTASDCVTELTLKIMDSDVGADDVVGEATRVLIPIYDVEQNIPLEGVFMEGRLGPSLYSVVEDQEYSGGIRVGLTFTREGVRDRGFPEPEESYGGWK